MASPWTAAEALDAVRDLMLPARRNGSRSGWKPERVELEGPEVLLVVFEVGGEQFGVRYSLADMSEGPQTGLPCATPAAWARDLWGDIDEEVATGVVGRADRLEGPEGLTLLRWWDGLVRRQDLTPPRPRRSRLGPTMPLSAPPGDAALRTLLDLASERTLWRSRRRRPARADRSCKVGV